MSPLLQSTLRRTKRSPPDPSYSLTTRFRRVSGSWVLRHRGTCRWAPCVQLEGNSSPRPKPISSKLISRCRLALCHGFPSSLRHGSKSATGGRRRRRWPRDGSSKQSGWAEEGFWRLLLETCLLHHLRKQIDFQDTRMCWCTHNTSLCVSGVECVWCVLGPRSGWLGRTL